MTSDRESVEIRLVREVVEAQTPAMGDATRASEVQGEQVFSLKIWLLGFTIALVALSVVLAWPELKPLWGQR